MEIVARTIGNAAGLWLATRLLSGLSVPEGVGTSHMWLNLLVLGLVLALVNSLIKPVAKFLTFPLYIITFGLFALVVNGAMLSLTGWLTDHIAALGAGGSVPLGLEDKAPELADWNKSFSRASGAGEQGTTTTEYTFAVQRNTDPNGIYKGGATYRGKVPSAQPSYPRPTPSPQSTGEH